MSVFAAMNDAGLAALIRRAHRRALLCAPSVRRDTAEALACARLRLGGDAVRVVLDCSEEVFRLGYGDLPGVESLQRAGIDIRQCAGLRLGLLVIDNQAWAFTPTALYVQPEVDSQETPNAVALSGGTVDELVAAVWAEAPAQQTTPCEAEPEIGQVRLEQHQVEQVAAGLAAAPPVAFNVARQVRVFEPYIQYVEIALRGCAIQKRRIAIPKSILRVGAAQEIEDRLRTTFELVQSGSEVSSKQLDDALRALRDDLTRPLGKPWGRVILRTARELFDKRVEEFRKQVEEHQKTVKTKLDESLKKSRDQIAEYYQPLVKERPPDSLRGQVAAEELTDDVVRAWLETELDKEFPKAEDLVRDMVLDVQFRDVTYETLNEDGFADALKAAYPHVRWEKPFQEFNAAKQRDADEQTKVQSA